MKPPIIVNESPAPLEPGCVYVLRSKVAAERYFEEWYSNESYYACDSVGQRLCLLPDENTGGVKIVRWNDEIERPDLAASFLRSYLSSQASTARWAKLGKSNAWLRSATLEEMAEVSVLFATE